MSRTINPAGWKPSCWSLAAVAAIAIALVVSHYSLGAP